MSDSDIEDAFDIYQDFSYESDGVSFLASIEFRGKKIYIDEKGMAFDEKMSLLPDRNRFGADIKCLIQQVRNKAGIPVKEL